MSLEQAKAIIAQAEAQGIDSVGREKLLMAIRVVAGSLVPRGQ